MLSVGIKCLYLYKTTTKVCTTTSIKDVMYGGSI